jgi:prevent-host-death family protein
VAFKVVQRDESEGSDKRVNIAEVRELLAELVNEVGFGGQRTVIMRRGKEVAAIVPMKDYDVLRAQPALPNMEVQQCENVYVLNGSMSADGGILIYGGSGN